MALRIENCALVGDMQTAALVGRDGSIDWLCLPRFDSGACFAALLGNAEHGHWTLAPDAPVRAVRRAYRTHTLIFETEFELHDGGLVRVVDCMPSGHEHSTVIRIVQGVRDQVPMRMELVIRFDYGSILPWLQRSDGGFTAQAGPDALTFHSEIPFASRDFRTTAAFTCSPGESLAFTLIYFPSHESRPSLPERREARDATERWWQTWCGHCEYDGEWREAVLRSLITLKALSHARTGGIVAAPTTSLPEKPKRRFSTGECAGVARQHGG